MGRATRPEQSNGLNLSTTQASRSMRLIDDAYRILPYDARIFPVWRNLVLQHEVKGKQVHDARLAAAYHVHNVSSILTDNVKDFQRFNVLTCFTPTDIITGNR